MKHLFRAALAAVVLALSGAAHAEQTLTPEQKAEIQRLSALRDSLKPVHGVVALPAAKASLNGSAFAD